MNNTYAAIMAGGIGSRFWPLSRESHPKQFLDILGTGKTLIQSTYDRFKKVCPKENIYILTNERYRDLVKEQLPELKDEQILGEPMRKNTAPTIAWFSKKIEKINPDALTVVAPSDHLVLNEDEFVRDIELALNFSKNHEALCTLGIKPTRPDTGYGYIQYREEEIVPGIHAVKTFTEKPSLKIARTFLESGDFLWNSGIFIWHVKSILRAFQTYLPEVYDVFEEIKDHLNTEEERPYLEKAFSLCSNISIDYGVMEKAKNVYVIPADFGWSDLGTWASLYANLPKDDAKNAIVDGNVLLEDSSKNIIRAPKEKLVVINGVKDHIIVDTEDVLLIFEKSREQELKQLLKDIKREKGDRYL